MSGKIGFTYIETDLVRVLHSDKFDNFLDLEKKRNGLIEAAKKSLSQLAKNFSRIQEEEKDLRKNHYLYQIGRAFYDRFYRTFTQYTPLIYKGLPIGSLEDAAFIRRDLVYLITKEKTGEQDEECMHLQLEIVKYFAFLEQKQAEERFYLFTSFSSISLLVGAIVGQITQISLRAFSFLGLVLVGIIYIRYQCKSRISVKDLSPSGKKTLQHER